MPLFLLEAKPLLFRYLLDAEVQRGIEENKKRKSESGGEGGRAVGRVGKKKEVRIEREREREKARDKEREEE